MNDRPKAHATFERPPLAEVSFGLAFAPLAGFRTADYGLFWSRLGAEFNETLDKPVIGDVASLAQDEWFPLPRVWFVHRNTEHLIQLQPNRFYFNWRLSAAKNPYPRFEVLKPLFESYLTKFGSFVAERGLGEIKASGFELSYVNHIPQGSGWNSIGDIGDVFPDVVWRKHERPEGIVDAFAWSAKFDGPAGVLNVGLKQGATKADPKQTLFIFELRVTRTSEQLELAQLSDWLDQANIVIVKAFEDLTSERMQQEVWKRVGS